MVVLLFVAGSCAVLIRYRHGTRLEVLAGMRARGPFDRTLYGGDFAFGGPRPREAVERLIETGYPAVIGNTDAMVAASPDGATGV